MPIFTEDKSRWEISNFSPIKKLCKKNAIAMLTILAANQRVEL